MALTQSNYNVEDTFPEDLTIPSIALITSSRCQLSLPCPNQPSPAAMLGSGVHSSMLEADDAQAPFRTKCAFSEKTISEKPEFRIESGAQSNFHKALTSNAQSSVQHMAVSFKASVDAGVVGASVSGRYNKDVIRNKDAFKASIQSTIRTGVIYIDGPRFSLDALADIRRLRKNVSPSFFDTYGNYYVDTMKLGADAGVLASRASSESIDSESRDIQVKVRVLWWEIEANFHEGTYSAERWSQFNVTAFDTLTGANVSDASLDEPPEKVAQEYIGKATSLDERVRDKMEELGLREDCKVDLETCREIFASGLVVEITLLPYSQLREFVMASIERD